MTDLAGSKSLISSQTFWGIAIASIPWLQDELTQISALPNLPHWAILVTGLLGSLIALVGRVSADKKISSIV